MKAKKTPRGGKLNTPERVEEIRRRLLAAIPEARCELNFANPWQLLVATILSAQSTDRTINKVTPLLFERWPTPSALAAASQQDVEAAVKPTGFFRNKAKAIREASGLIVERHGGEVPRTLEQLTKLPGVARKTANVVLGTAYGKASGVVVDTHVGRVSRRLGLTRHEDPKKVEADLCKALPSSEWIHMGHRLLLHGRYLCKARAPDCARCPLNELCPTALTEADTSVQARTQHENRLVPA